jgi:lipid II:glycine glycyltransferase (peptidoglycan interpeptide bridge formation enzyme)
MSEWRLFSGSSSSWNNLVSNFDNSTYLHGNEWSEHLGNKGWKTCRWEYHDSGQIISLLQGFLKTFPFGTGVVWFPDWIIGDYEACKDLGKIIQESLELRFIYIRVRSHKEVNDFDNDIFINNHFTNPKKILNYGQTMHLDLNLSEESLSNGLSRNWKRNLKRSTRTIYKISEIKNPKVVIKIYNELARIKKIDSLLSSQDINSIYDSFHKKIVVIGAHTPDGVMHAVRGAIVVNGKATDIFAASNSYARKHFLSYATCWNLIIKCKELGCYDFNLNGVDPVNNAGVYNFKKGTGAKLKIELGEFEKFNLKILSSIVNLYLNKG